MKADKDYFDEVLIFLFAFTCVTLLVFVAIFTWGAEDTRYRCPECGWDGTADERLCEDELVYEMVTVYNPATDMVELQPRWVVVYYYFCPVCHNEDLNRYHDEET